MCENREIYSVLDEFFHHYFVERDAEKTLSLLSDHLYSIGTGEGEVALEKAAFRELLYDEIALLPGPLHYTITIIYIFENGIYCCIICFHVFPFLSVGSLNCTNFVVFINK